MCDPRRGGGAAALRRCPPMTLPRLERLCALVLFSAACPLVGPGGQMFVCTQDADCTAGLMCADGVCANAEGNTASSSVMPSSTSSAPGVSSSLGTSSRGSSRASSVMVVSSSAAGSSSVGHSSSAAASSVMFSSSASAMASSASEMTPSSSVGLPSSSVMTSSSAVDPCATAGAPCATGLMGLCAQGQLVCINNALECQVTIEPGTRRESCANPGVDNDCDGNGTELEDGVAAGTPCDGEFYGPCTGSPGMLGCAAGMRLAPWQWWSPFFASGRLVHCRIAAAP